jgi:hypothetical protein
MGEECNEGDRAESNAMETDYVVLGGGNAKLIKKLPAKVFLGSNDNAFKGAFMLWQNEKK